MKVGLVIPVLNNFEQALDLIYSAKSKEHEVIVYVQPQYKFQRPLASAWNTGIQEAMDDGCDYILVANDDTILAPHTIDDAVQWMSSENVNLDILGFTNVLDTFDDPFEIVFVEHDHVFTPHRHTSASGLYSDDMFSLFMIGADFFSKFGTFDENFDPAWWEDTDMLYRVHLLGGDVFQTPIPYVHRMHQTTINLNAPVNSMKSGEYYIKKWGSAKKDLKELYVTPYNNPNMSPKEWN